ncbi:hypothetical protein ACIQH0_28310 [Streptomyces griseus]|uniref:hypothetical protein n=1 Tax=Streptomyces griseus TaxID=1911 RepID=UPI00380D23F4
MDDPIGTIRVRPTASTEPRRFKDCDGDTWTESEPGMLRLTKCAGDRNQYTGIEDSIEDVQMEHGPLTEIRPDVGADLRKARPPDPRAGTEAAGGGRRMSMEDQCAPYRAKLKAEPFASIVPNRRPEVKLHAGVGLAKLAVGYSTGSGARGGEIYGRTADGWELLYCVESGTQFADLPWNREGSG